MHIVEWNKVYRLLRPSRIKVDSQDGGCNRETCRIETPTPVQQPQNQQKSRYQTLRYQRVITTEYQSDG